MRKIRLHVALMVLPLTLGVAASAGADYTWYSYGGHEYTYCQGYKTWTNAETEAVGLGGHLVTINGSAEETWLQSTFGNFHYWIGFNQISSSPEPDGGWVWSSGEPVTYTNWSAGEPNNYLDAEDKGVMNWNYMNGWNDLWNDELMLQGIIERSSPVPLPSALLLLGSGLAGLAAAGVESVVARAFQPG